MPLLWFQQSYRPGPDDSHQGHDQERLVLRQPGRIVPAGGNLYHALGEKDGQFGERAECQDAPDRRRRPQCDAAHPQAPTDAPHDVAAKALVLQGRGERLKKF